MDSSRADPDRATQRRLAGRRRERGYRWDAERRCWRVLSFTREEAKAEAAWLKPKIYAGEAHEIEVEVIDASVRRKRMLQAAGHSGCWPVG